MELLLAGDIGGTKTHLALISPEAGPRAPLAEATFLSARYPSLEAVVCEFLTHRETSEQQLKQLERASFGVAGPVIAGRVTATNLPWVVDELQLSLSLQIPSVHLLNDLVAIAHAVPYLNRELPDLYVLNQGEPISDGAIAVIAPGTGLGEAYLTWNGSRYLAHPSEGGHTDFGPKSELEIGLLRYLRGKMDHVSYEWLCSGIGIPNIYAYLKDSGYAVEPDWLAKQLATATDSTPVISNAALDRERPCELCTATLDTFVSILGAEAGNLALKVLSTGGVYLGGGIPPRILPALQQRHFIDAFRSKGRLSTLLERMPIYVILNPKVALLGAAYYDLE